VCYNGNTRKGGSKVLQGFDEWLLRGAEEALGEDESVVCSRCKNEVSFEDVTKGYYAVCPEHDEDLYEFETEVGGA
jgi:hypothetical protein